MATPGSKLDCREAHAQQTSSRGLHTAGMGSFKHNTNVTNHRAFVAESQGSTTGGMQHWLLPKANCRAGAAYQLSGPTVGHRTLCWLHHVASTAMIAVQPSEDTRMPRPHNAPNICRHGDMCLTRCRNAPITKQVPPLTRRHCTPSATV